MTVRSYRVGDVFQELIDDESVPDHLEVEVVEERLFRLVYHNHNVTEERLEQFHDTAPHQVRLRMVGLDDQKPRMMLFITKAGSMPWYASEFDPHNFQIYFEDTMLGDYDYPIEFEVILVDSDTGEIRGNSLIRSPLTFSEQMLRGIHLILQEKPLTREEHVLMLEAIQQQFASIEEMVQKTAALGFEA